MVNDTEVNSPHLRAYYANASAKALDDHTLEITWKESEYTNVQFSLNMSPVARHVYIRERKAEKIFPSLIGRFHLMITGSIANGA